MANSANPEINKKIATSALGTLFIATVFFYLGDRYAETLVTYPGQIFDHLSDAFLSMWETIGDAPFTLDMTSNSLLFGGACFLIIWMIWLRYVAFIGNYRSGEESGSARWGTLKEGKKFKDLQTEDNNLLFTKNFGLALHRPKFDPEYDRNLNVLVVGGSGSGKTFNYVTPNICQLNTSYFVTDPKGTLLKDAGYLFTDNGYKLKSFNTINLDESMHYNPLKYVKTDTDILSFVNCFIMNTNPEGKSSGDPFWENAEKMLYTALIALLRDWFPAKDYNMSSLLTLLSLAEARENDENFKSALDLMFLQIEEGKKYKQNDGSSPDAAGNAGLSRSFGTKQADNGWSWVPSKFKRNSDGVKPADCGGLSADEDFALMNYKNFKVAAGKTLKSILISCNVRLAPIATDGVRELLTYDEMEIDTLGDPDAKVAIFGILSDTDKTLSFLFAILMWQTIDQLCRKALSDYGGKLPTPVHFIFDEFANIGTIPQIEETIAVTRSRNIGITIILQSICEVEEGMFSSSIAFDDTSYHSVRDEQQKAMFSAITRLYDQFGADTLVQMSVINTPLLKEEVGHRKFFDPERQANDAARNDAQVFNNILNDKVKEGVSNIRRNRYLTYSVTADTAEDAARQLSRIEVESSRILNSIGSKAHLMNGTQRLSVIHSLLNPYKPFLFDYQRDISAKRLQTTKDCIAPTQIDFRPDGHYNDCVKLDNGVYAQVLVMKKFGSELSDRALADMADLPIPMAITWYVQPMDKSKAINYVRTRSAWIDKEIIEEQRSAVNKGYDFSILPQELKYSKEETEDVLDHLQNKNQRLYVFTGLVYTYAESKEALDTQVLRIISTARQNSIELDTYDYRQRQGLNSILPLGHNHVEISRMFTTAQVSILVPFATQELDDAGGNFYGQNKHSRNLVVCNRKKLTSPMGFVCGKTGSGKGMFTKTEMTGTIFSNPTDEIYVIDRAGEYTAIAERYGGSTYHFGVGTGTHLNPFDTVSVEHMTRNEQIAFKVDAMLAQAGASAAEAGSNFSEVDQSLVQRCTELAFQKAAERGDNLPPTLQDFYDAANEQPEEQAQVIALRYERFVKGSMNFFNHQSNVDFNTRIVDFNLKDLPYRLQ